ncbi:MAG: metallophosphoesterase [Melioribacteraceae bacterium]
MNMFAFAIKVIIVLVLVFLIEFYFLKKVTWSIKTLFPKVSKKKLKFWKRVGLLLLNLFPVSVLFLMAYYYFTNNYDFALPENSLYDYFILFPFWVGTIIIVQSILLFLLVDILKIISYPFYKKTKSTFYRKEAKIFFAILFLSIIYVPSRILYDYYSVDVRQVVFEKSNLPQALDGLRIAVISDLQADRYTDYDRLENFVEKLNDVKSDLVLISGDIITHSPDYINLAAKKVGEIKAKHGVYTCVGDHDNWAYRLENKRSVNEITEALEKVNVPMIDNENLFLGIDTATIKISFITNTYVGKVEQEVLDSLTINKNDTDLKIFLTHQPREHLISKAVEQNYDLYFCGHTHGGQITFLFPFYNLSPTMAETLYLKGDFWFEKTIEKSKDLLMIVTGGLGMSLAPLRYNSTPEITVVTLRKSKE